MRKWIVSLASAFTVLLLAGSTAYAQNAQVSGALKDQTGGVLPGVTVTAKNLETGLTRSAVSEASGDYRVPALPPGTYTVTPSSRVSAPKPPGHHPHHRPGCGHQFHAEAGLGHRSADGHGEAPIVDTTKSDVSTSVSTQQIQDLPVASAAGSTWRCYAGHLAGQHPRVLLSRQRQHRRRHPRYRTGSSWTASTTRGPRWGNRARTSRWTRSRVQGVDVELQGGGWPRDRRPADGGDEIRDQPDARLGTAVLPRLEHHGGGIPAEAARRAAERAGGNQRAGLSPLSIRRHDRRTDRPRQDAFLLRLRGDEGTAELHDQHQRHLAAVRGRVPQQADPLDVQREGRSPASPSQSVFFRFGAEDEYRPIITTGDGRRRARARFRRAAAVGGAEPHG